MATELVVVEKHGTYHAASKRARELAMRFNASVTVRRAPNDWNILVHPDIAAQLPKLARPEQPKSVEGYSISKTARVDSRDEQLYVLKAFYLGHAIAENPASRTIALSMINAAISQLEDSITISGKFRLTFYLMLRAEVARHVGEIPLEDRTRIENLCGEINSSMFKLFMKVEACTQERSKAYGIQKLTIGNPGVKPRAADYWENEGYESGWLSYDSTGEIIGLDSRHLTEDEKRFLWTTPLKQLMEDHGLFFTM